MKLNKSRCIALAVIAIGIAMLWQSLLVKPLFPVTQGDCGPGFFPALVSVGLIISGIGKFLLPVGDSGNGKPFMQKGGWLKMGIGLLWCLVYVLGLKYIGFFVTTSVMLFALVLLLGWKEKTNYLVAGLYSVGFSGLIYLLFTYVLGTLLPRGLLF